MSEGFSEKFDKARLAATIVELDAILEGEKA